MTDWRQREAARLREQIANETTTHPDGSQTWNTNNAPVPMGCYKDAGLEAPAAQQAAVHEHTDRVLGNYRAAQARRTPEQIAEERMEARAAMGEGEEMVNIITGERWTT